MRRLPDLHRRLQERQRHAAGRAMASRARYRKRPISRRAPHFPAGRVHALRQSALHARLSDHGDQAAWHADRRRVRAFTLSAVVTSARCTGGRLLSLHIYTARQCAGMRASAASCAALPASGVQRAAGIRPGRQGGSGMPEAIRATNRLTARGVGRTWISASPTCAAIACKSSGRLRRR